MDIVDVSGKAGDCGQQPCAVEVRVEGMAHLLDTHGNGLRSKTGNPLGARCLVGPESMSMTTSAILRGFKAGIGVWMGRALTDLAAVAVHFHNALPSTAEDAKTDAARRGTA